MITAKFYLDIRSQKKDKTFPIKINVTHNRKALLISTGFSVSKDNWKNNQISSNEPNYRAKNVRLRDMMNKVEKVIFSLGESGQTNSINNTQLKRLIEEKLFGEEKTAMTFIDWLDKFLETKIKPGTRKV